MNQITRIQLKTERQLHDESILYVAREFVGRTRAIWQEIESLKESPGETTPYEVAYSLGEVARTLNELASLFYNHLESAELADTLGGGVESDGNSTLVI